MLSGIMLSGVMLSGVMLSGIMLSGVMLSGIMPSGVMLSGVMLHVKCIILLNVVSQRVNQGLKQFSFYSKTSFLVQVKFITED